MSMSVALVPVRVSVHAHPYATAGYFYYTFAYETCFYGIYFYRITFHGKYFYKALTFFSIDCIVVRIHENASIHYRKR